MLIVVAIIVIATLVSSIERSLLKMPLRERAHNNYYPFPSYSRQRYYRKITFLDNGHITVHDNFKMIQQTDGQLLPSEDESPFLSAVRDIAKKKTPLRLVECRKIPGVLVYTDNTQSPTHVFCINRHVSEIVRPGKCDIKDEIDQISRSIVDREKWSLNQFGLVVLMVNLEYLPHVVWGKHGDYIVGWSRVDPVILIRIGDEVKSKLEKFHKKNPTLSSMVKSEWDRQLFLCTIESSRMRLMVKHSTPKSIFSVDFRKKLSYLGSRSYTSLGRKDRELVNKTKSDIYTGKMLHMEIEDRDCFENELGQFLQNLKEFVSDGTCFKLSPPDN